MKLRVTTLTMMVLVSALLTDARAAGNSQAGGSLPANFHMLPGPQAVVSTPQTLINADPSSVQMAFYDPPLTIGNVVISGEGFAAVRLPGEGSTFEPGAPELPRLTRLIMVSNAGMVRLRVTEATWHEELLESLPAPYKALEGDDTEAASSFRNEAIYGANSFYPDQVASISQPMVLRDVRFVILAVCPVQVNPVTRVIRVYDRIEVAVENAGGIGENELQHRPTSLTPGFKRLYTLFENFEGSALDELPVVPGKQLIICANDAMVISEVNRLVTWRRKKGIDAYYTTLTTIGGNDPNLIRNYIVNQYISSNGQLEFVTLFGDPSAGGVFDVATAFSQYDNYFGTMSGGPNPDPIPDIAVGRMPIQSYDHANAIVAKTIQYESDPYVSDTTWFTRAWCAAHTSYVPSNPSTKEYTRQIMLQHGMRTVHWNTFSGGMQTTILNTRINEGVCVFNDRMSWIGEFYSSQLDGLNNGRKQPLVLVITCDTGTFTNEALTEEWVRRGTASVPVGAIGAIGMAGSGTHVPYNNIVDAGVMFGLYVQRIKEQGIALIAGKLQLFKNYYEFGRQSSVESFSYWSNLMGDPAVPIWIEVPRTPIVTRPATVHRNTNNITVTVTQAGSPVEGALVGLLKGTETFSRGYTNAAGLVNLPVSLPTTGYVYLTVTRENLDTYLDSIQVVTPMATLSYFSHSVDDDNSGGTVGDGDAVLNPGETADLSIRLQNSGTSQTATGIVATMTSGSSGILVVNGTQNYPDITVGANAAPVAPFRIQVNQVFNGEPVSLFLNVTSSAGTQVVRLDLTPVAGDAAFVSSQFLDGNSRLDPGETGNFTVTFINNGNRSLTNASGILRSLDAHITVNDSLGTFGNVAAGSSATNGSNTFNVTASGLSVGGYRSPMMLVVTDANGFRDSTSFFQTIGVVSLTTPTGPDAYGYYAYDNTETQPSGSACQYAWVEIAPSPGTSLGFTDGAEDQDQSAARRLPFTFRFYGQDFDSITVCTNGWLAFGHQTAHTDFRNYRIGSPLGPTNMVAAYWDDLIVTGVTNGGVWVYSDTTNHRYIVEWRTRTLWSGVTQIFQVILYDPAFHASPTGDGKILVQYNTLTPSQNSGTNDNDWATAGIQNADHSVGLEYCYWNTYPASAPPLQSGRAIMYTTDVSGFLQPPLTLVGPNGGETWYIHNTVNVSWVGAPAQDNIRIELSRNGVSGPWETIVASTPNDGTHNFIASSPISTACRIRLTNVNNGNEQDVSDADFTIAALRVLTPNGGETWFRDSLATITWVGGNPSSQVSIELSRRGLSGLWQYVTTSTANTGSYAFTVTGGASDTCRVRVSSLTDPLDTDVSDNDFSIRAVQFVLQEGFEAGAPGWTHSSPGGQWLDDWHISTERAFAGMRSYKCGDAAAGNYRNFNDARLTSPVITNLPINSTLQYYQQIESEISGTFPDSAYDGGVLEISVNGGAYQVLIPSGGYPKTFRWLAGGSRLYSGPMPGRGCFAGNISTWSVVSADLTPYAGQSIQLRWRFGSDTLTTNEGWYVDNVSIYAPAPAFEPTPPQQLTIAVSGNNLIFSWADDDNPAYRIYSSPNPGGPFETLESSTTALRDTLENVVPLAGKKFYIVVGWDGN